MLELSNVTAGYKDLTVLENVTATFQKGELTSIIGTNGCGKSTLLKTILGILSPANGEITLGGRDLHAMSQNQIAKRIAYLAQGKNTPDMTVEQMVLHGRFPYLNYPRRYAQRDIEIAREAMEAVGIAHLAKKPLATLSGGMRQTAYIAMALAQDTDYILLDEPTTYLDVAHSLALMKLLRRLADSGKGIVTVMHDLPLAFEFSNDLLVLENGKVKAQAAPNELLDTAVIPEVFGVRIKTTHLSLRALF